MGSSRIEIKNAVSCILHSCNLVHAAALKRKDRFLDETM